jgi:hypothetical protein
VTADKDNKNILAQEVESWKGFEYALPNPNTSSFNKMLTLRKTIQYHSLDVSQYFVG